MSTAHDTDQIEMAKDAILDTPHTEKRRMVLRARADFREFMAERIEELEAFETTHGFIAAQMSAWARTGSGQDYIEDYRRAEFIAQNAERREEGGMT